MLSVWRLCSLNTLHRPSGVFMLTSALPSGASVHFYGRVVGSEEVWTGLCGAENSLKDQAVVDPLPVGREPDREFADKLLVGRVEIELDRLPSHGRRNGHSGPPCGRIGLRGGFRFLFFWLGGTHRALQFRRRGGCMGRSLRQYLQKILGFTVFFHSLNSLWTLHTVRRVHIMYRVPSMKPPVARPLRVRSRRVRTNPARLRADNIPVR